MKILFQNTVYLIVFLSSHQVFAEWEVKSLKLQKAEAKRHLEQRKKAFDAWYEARKQRDKERVSEASLQKKFRKENAEKQEKARVNFERQTSPFPDSAYQNFLARREKDREFSRNARKEYSQVQKELRKVFQNKKYRISGKKEFDL